MKASTWNWQRYAPRDFKLWRRVRTLGGDWGNSLVQLAKIPGAYVPGLNKALDTVGDVIARFSADLSISPLDGPNSLRALNGSPRPVAAKNDMDHPVFYDGVDATLTVKHNGQGSENELIVLEWIDLCVVDFVPGKDPGYSIEPEGEEIIGAGLMEPMRFFVEIEGRNVQRARREVSLPEGKSGVLISSGDNFLNTDPPVYFSFTPKEKPQIFRFTISALQQGYYLVCLRFFYRVANKELRQYTSEPVRLYTDIS
jgi:hypothetical protein